MPEEALKSWYEDAATLMSELEPAVDERKRKLSEWPRQISDYHGSYFRGRSVSGRKGKAANPKNFAFSWNTRIIPEIAWQNPRVDTEAIAPGVTEHDLLLQKVALNQLIHDLKLSGFLARGPLLNAQWTCGYAMIAMEPITGMPPVDVPPIAGWNGSTKQKREPMRPRVYDLPPSRVLEDPNATTLEEIRFVAYDWKRSKQEIIEEAKADPSIGWNLDLLDGMDSDSGNDEDSMAWGPKDVENSRSDVYGRTVWIPNAKPIDPENTPEKGYHGILCVIPANGNADDESDWLRPPRDFFGPPFGPIYRFGIHSVPGYAAFLGPLTATQEQADSLALTASANTQSARNFKQMVLVNDKNPRLVQQIRSGRHHYVYGAKEFTNSDVASVAIGGISDQNLIQEQREQSELDDLSGLGELQRGVVTGKATATENVHAENNGSVRFEWIEQRAYDCTQTLLEGLAWYLEQHEDVLFPLSQESARQLGFTPKQAMDEDGYPLVGPDGSPILKMDTTWFRGGKKDPDSLVVATSKVKIIPKSMSRRGNQRERQATMEFYGWLSGAMAWLRQHPELTASDIIDDAAEALGLPRKSNRVDWELFEELQKQQYGMLVQSQTPELDRAPGYGTQVGNSGNVAPGGWGNGQGGRTPGPRLPGAAGAAGLGSPGLTGNPAGQGGQGTPIASGQGRVGGQRAVAG